MRGRTNITQRTGPSVIGNLVTQKQVTGSKIEVGDFVEFTGDTSAWESLAGPFNYTYSGKFNVNSNYNGIFYQFMKIFVFYFGINMSKRKFKIMNINLFVIII